MINKGRMAELKTIRTLILVFVTLAFIGCNELKETQPSPAVQTPPEKEKVFLTVDFQQGKKLRYKFVSNRNITVDWGTTKKGSKTSRNIKRSSERAEMVFSYRPVEVDTYGLTTIEVKCESVKTNRSGTSTTSRDALRHLRGKTFTLKINAVGAIKDYSSLRELAYQVGEKAFRDNTTSRRIKDPDMVRDFIATQWFLWDTISSVPKPSEGLREGQTWQSQLSVPLPMLIKPARDVVYTLKQIKENEKGKIAVIKSTYSLGEPIPKRWPLPYEGSFMMSGQFGFFTRYKVLSLKGSGEQLFDIEAGRIERDRQNYSVELETSSPMLQGKSEEPKPKTIIRQSITMTMLED